jgi:hypothetical protein
MKAKGSLDKVETVFDYMDYNSSGTINMHKFLQYVDNMRREESLQALHEEAKQQQQLAARQESARIVDLRPLSAKDSATFLMNYAVSMSGSRRLSLTSRRIGDGDMRVIADNLANNTMLRFLVLSRNDIGVDGVSMLATSLRTNTTLTRLDIGSNKFGNEGVILLAVALRNNSTLQRLDLYNTRMQESGARAIANSLMVNKTLRELSLQGNRMGNTSAMMIGEALRHNTVLTSLFLQDNDIDPIPGMLGFVTSMYSCDDFVLEKLEGINLADFSGILDIKPPATPVSTLSNSKILGIMRKRRGLQVSKRVLNK